jgi:hypothetical protein
MGSVELADQFVVTFESGIAQRDSHGERRF